MPVGSLRGRAASALITAGAATAAVLGLAVPAVTDKGAFPMGKNIIRVAVAVVAAGAFSALGVSGAGASGAATRAGQPAVHAAVTVSGAAAVPGAQLWVKRYSPGTAATSVAVSPGGGTVFVTGESVGGYATVAYNAATGAQRWVKRYGNGNDFASSVAVSPGGGTVFVTGYSTAASSGADYATVAYSAATGAQRWVQRYKGPGNLVGAATSVAVSPAGGTVYVTGGSPGATSGEDYATVAYSAATGAQQWLKRYNGPGNLDDQASQVAVSPSGGTVFVTGGSQGLTAEDYATVAYRG
jgi:WD40 repeat protein